MDAGSDIKAIKNSFLLFMIIIFLILKKIGGREIFKFF